MQTRVTDILGIDHPVLSAGIPIMNVDLVAAVSNAGALGILGATHLTPEEIRDRIAALRQRTTRPFGLNLLVPFCTAAQLEACIDARVPVLSTAWGPPDDSAARARAAGIPVVHMVTTAEQGAAAARAGVSVIVAQGHEAGGGLVGPVGGMVITPAVVDAVRAVVPGSSAPPVVAAGGIADGRGLAAALMLGAEGVLLGTRFLATDEAPVPSAWKSAICGSTEVDTVYTRIANLVARPTWAPVAPSRVLRTHAVTAWLGREAELEGLPPAERATIAARWGLARSEGTHGRHGSHRWAGLRADPRGPAGGGGGTKDRGRGGASPRAVGLSTPTVLAVFMNTPNKAVERPAGSHSLAAAAHCRR